jgi:hypothetical protein
MKYEPMIVISQMTTSRTRPMEREPPEFGFSAFPTEALTNPQIREVGETKTGRIYHRFFSKQAGSCILEK